jgi:hypothetical protein
VVGGDGGGLDDLYGLCVAGRERGTDRWLYWTKAWCWPDVLERRKQIAPLLQGLRKADGDLVICDELARVESATSGDYELPQDIREIVEIIETGEGERGCCRRRARSGSTPRWRPTWSMRSTRRTRPPIRRWSRSGRGSG